ncbi:YncE family protein [Hyalangium versicolor]|uniref:YncE family protein n=1 Tax=Hyalangium versicolor TaxID=2861190 RepID=UPI001CCDABED|nr:YncE family protein [Hyalangium versicolor]
MSALQRMAGHAVSSFTLIAILFFCGSASALPSTTPTFTVFDSGQVRPLALSPNGKLLFAVNTPDNRLEVFQLSNQGLIHRASVPVGLEPVAVAARSNEEIWVVNHLSDSVSVVRLGPSEHSGTVVRTLLVGDEPRDIVFAGPGMNRAFITTAHRGQNVPYDPQFTTPGIGRADVWVFDAARLQNPVSTGNPLTILTLFSDTPRALAVTPDGSRVYAAAFHSGNRTTVIEDTLVPPGGMPGPYSNTAGDPAPPAGVIVKFDGQHWVDVLNRPWDSQVRFSLPDKDVFVIDANANPPAQLPGSAGFYSGVGTVLFNMAVNPVSGKVYVSNTEARNDLRFEGEGLFGGHTLRGHLHESRITVLSPAGVTPRHLNKHIDYSTCCAPLPNAENEKSLAQPLGMTITSDGATLYVAAFGSSKLGVYSTAALEADTFVPGTNHQIPVSGGGPTGLVLDEAHRRLYVLTRFDNAISVIDTATRAELAHVPMYNPEPPSVVAGRPFLYDARRSSSHGDSSCGSCHIFGDLDSLAWDLGNPDGTVLNNPGPFIPVPPVFGDDPLLGIPSALHPMKGPMVTQSLRGMANHGPMHWRGDRTGGNDEPSAQPNSGAFNEAAAFKKFNPAFTSLLGRNAQLSTAEMQQFTDFILQLSYPPNPVRNLDNSLTPAQQAGRDFFFGTTIAPHGTCETCHRLDPQANPEEGAFAGFFGADGRTGFAMEPQALKVPHLRNMYQKVGMFGAAFSTNSVEPDPFMGDQIRGVGFNHDGTFPTLFRFNSGFDKTPLNANGIPVTPAGAQAKRDMEQYMLAFDTNLAPIVGQQVTLTAHNFTAAAPRIHLLKSRAEAGECELVAKGRVWQLEAGFLYTGGGWFKSAWKAVRPVSDEALRAMVVLTDGALTYTCTPLGSGPRIGIDQDLDGALDGDERAAGSNPADANSVP